MCQSTVNQTPDLKPLTKSAVSSIVSYLFVVEGKQEITTLEVKELLRNSGFFAVQDEVSYFVLEYANHVSNPEHALDIDDKKFVLRYRYEKTGGHSHRVFFLEEVVEADVPVTTATDYDEQKD